MLAGDTLQIWRELGGRSSVLSFHTDDDLIPDLEERLAAWKARLACLSPDSRVRLMLENPHNRADRIWRTSRHCLVEVLELLARRGVPVEEMSVSLSHTEGASVAIGAANQNIGVDVECTARTISELDATELFSAQERNRSLSSLELWVIKEAAFKADPKNSRAMVTDYHWVGENLVATPWTRLQFRVARMITFTGNWTIGFARSVSQGSPTTLAESRGSCQA